MLAGAWSCGSQRRVAGPRGAKPPRGPGCVGRRAELLVGDAGGWPARRDALAGPGDAGPLTRAERRRRGPGVGDRRRGPLAGAARRHRGARVLAGAQSCWSSTRAVGPARRNGAEDQARGSAMRGASAPRGPKRWPARGADGRRRRPLARAVRRRRQGGGRSCWLHPMHLLIHHAIHHARRRPQTMANRLERAFDPRVELVEAARRCWSAIREFPSLPQPLTYTSTAGSDDRTRDRTATGARRRALRPRSVARLPGAAPP